jgi:hypothetical protein
MKDLNGQPDGPQDLCSKIQLATHNVGSFKDQLWKERQHIKHWYENRIEGLRGDEYIVRCIIMVEWWLKITIPNTRTLDTYNEFKALYPESVDSSEFYNAGANDIKELNDYLCSEFGFEIESIGWLVLAEAVVECAVGSLIEINEDIAEDAETDELQEYFTNVVAFWTTFYEIAFEPIVTMRLRQTVEPKPSILLPAQKQTSQYHNMDDSPNPIIGPESINQLITESLNNVIVALNAPESPLFSLGGFSQIPKDFEFLGLIKHGLIHRYLSKDAVVLFSSTYAYCISLLYQFYLHELNGKVGSMPKQILDSVNDMVGEQAEKTRLRFGLEIDKFVDQEFELIDNLRIAKPSTFSISLKRRVNEALDMALALLREAVIRSKAVESSSGISTVETMACLLKMYSPVPASYLKDPNNCQLQTHQFELFQECSNVLEDLDSNPHQLLDDIFTLWITISSSSENIMSQPSEDILPTIGGHSIVSSVFDSNQIKGKALITRVSNMIGEPPEFQAKSCGYLRNDNEELGDVEAFYAALYSAYRT